MTTVIAAIDDSPTAGSVLRLARTWAALLEARLRSVHVSEGDDPGAQRAADDVGVPLEICHGDPAQAILDLAADPEVALLVLGSRRGPGGRDPAGHIAVSVLERAGVPVLVVPPEVGPVRPRVRNVVVPLEGSAPTTACMGPLLHRLHDAGVRLVALHVFAEQDVPRFRDHGGHAEESLATAFASRWCPGIPTEVRLRVGAATAATVDVADIEDADAIALGWSQDLSPGHASVVRTALSSESRPVLLVPLAT